MKSQGIFPGTILIGLGVFFLLKQWAIPFVDQLYSWPSILIVLGLAFFLQAIIGKDASSYFPSVILLGLGSHFHAIGYFSFWPNEWGVYTLIIGIAFLVRYQKTKKDGLFLGILFVFISILGLFSTGYISFVGTIVGFIESFWPIVLIIIGLYLWFKKS
jgi:hypothetical protein